MHDVTTKPPPVTPAAVAPQVPAVLSSPNYKPPPDRRLWEIRWVRDLAIVFMVLVAIWLMWEVRSILTPVMVGFGLAYAFNPLVTYLDRKMSIRRSMSTSGLLIIGLSAVVGLSVYFGPTLVYQTSNLIRNFPKYIDIISRKVPVHLNPFVMHGPGTNSSQVVVVTTGTQPAVVVMPSTTQPGSVTVGTSTQPGTANVGGTTQPSSVTIQTSPPTPTEPADQEAAEIRADAGVTNSHVDRPQLTTADVERVSSWIMQFAGQGYSVIATGIGLVTYIIIAITLTGCCFWYFSWKFDRIIAWFARFIPPEHNEHVCRIIKRMDTTVAGFIRGRLIQASSMGLLLIIGWTFVGVPYALLLGVLGGMLHLIPYLGGAVWPLALLMAWINVTTANGGHFDVFWIILYPTLVYFIAQSTDSWIIEPIVQSRATHLDAITVMIAVIVGAELAGIFGMLLAIPITACGKILFQELVLPRLLPKAKVTG